MRQLCDEHRWHELARLHACDRGHQGACQTLSAQSHARHQDLVLDLAHAITRHAMIEPWLKVTTPPPPDREQLQSPEERAALDGHYECVLCFRCTGGCPSSWWNADRCLGPAVLLQAYRWIVDSRDEATGDRLDALEDPVSALPVPQHPQL